MVKQFGLQTNQGSIEINTLDLPSGIYFCSILGEDRVLETLRLVVLH